MWRRKINACGAVWAMCDWMCGVFFRRERWRAVMVKCNNGNHHSPHVLTHLDGSGKPGTWLCKSNVKVDQSQTLKVKSVLTPVGTVRLHRFKKKKKTNKNGRFNIWKRVKRKKHQTSVHSQPYRGHKLTLKVHAAAQHNAPQPRVCGPPVSPPQMEWWWWKGQSR